MSTNFSTREVCDLTFCDYITKTPFLKVDYANTSATELTGTTTYAYGGKGHPKKIAFNGEKGGTISFETQIHTMKLYSLITGGNIENSAQFIKREVIKATVAGKLTVTGTPISGTVNVFNENDDCGVAIEATVNAKEVSASGILSGSNYIVYYIEQIAGNVKKINIKSTTFPKAFTAYAETFSKDSTEMILIVIRFF